MSVVLRIILIVTSLLFNALVLNMVRIGRVEMRYALAWLFVGLSLLLFSLFPNLLSFIARLMGVTVPINAALFLAILFLMTILIGITIVVSSHKSRIYKLTQLLAIQEKRIAELEKTVKESGKA